MNLLTAIREIASFRDLTAEEEQLLGDLIVRWHHRDAITMSGLMRASTRTSASTIYRRLVGLKDKGLITLRIDEGDRRVRFVEPTEKAHDYIEQLGRKLDALIASERQG